MLTRLLEPVPDSNLFGATVAVEFTPDPVHPDRLLPTFRVNEEVLCTSDSQ